MKTENINGMAIYRSNVLPGKPTIVFLHDSLGCIELWRDFPVKVAAAVQCNLLIYDRWGYGKSDPMPTHVRPVNYLELEAAILNELLTELEIEDAILFGHSDGGSIALITAAKHPDKIRAVIAEAAHIFVEEATLNGISVALDLYETTDLRQRLEKYHGTKTETLFKAWTETWKRNDFRDWNIEHLLAGITCPLLFIQGENDEYGSLEQVEKTISHVRGTAEKFIVPNIGHTPHKEDTETVLKKTVDYILSLSN